MSSAQQPSIDWANALLTPHDYGGEAEGTAIALDAAGNTYVLGYFKGTIDFNPDPKKEVLLSAKGEEDVFLAKFDPSGKYIWANAMGSESSDAGLALAVDNLGNLFVTGYFSATISLNPHDEDKLFETNGGQDIFVAKYKSDGTYDLAFTLGGRGNDQASSIAVQGSSDIYITGSFEESANFNPNGANNLSAEGASDIFVAKYTSSGNYLWAFSVGSQEQDYGKAMALDGSGNVYLAGKLTGKANFNPQGEEMRSSAGASDIFLAKYDYNGTFEWANNMGGKEEDEATALTVDIRGNVFLTGKFSAAANFNPQGELILQAVGKQDVFIANYNNQGLFQWAERMGGVENDFGTAIEIVGRNHLVITGGFAGTADFDPSDKIAALHSEGNVQDIFIAKYSLKGEFVWANRVGGTFSETSNALALNAKGQVYLTGSFEGASDFDPSENKAILNTNAIQTLFVAHYDAESSNYGYAFGVGYRYDASISKIKAIQVDNDHNLYVAGYFEGAVNFNPKGNQVLISQGRWSDIFVAKYDSSGQFIWVRQFGAAGKDRCNSMVIDDKGNLYLSGSFEAAVKFDKKAAASTVTKGEKDIFLLKLNNAGDFQWVKQLGGTGNDQGQALAFDEKGYVHMVAAFEGKLNTGIHQLDADQALLIAKYSVNGQIMWVNMLEGLASSDHGAALAVDADGNSYVAGRFSGLAAFDKSRSTTLKSLGGEDAFLVKYNAEGKLGWTKRMGGLKDDRATGLAVNNNGVYVTGRFKANTSFGAQTLKSKGSTDIFLAKYSLAGDFSWVRSVGGTSHEEGVALYATDDGSIYLSGYFQNTVFFNADQSIKLSSVSIISSDIFLSKFNENGDCIWAQGFGGTERDQGNVLYVSNTKAIYLAVTFQQRVNFDPRGTKPINNKAIPPAAALLKYLDYEFKELALNAFYAKRTNPNEVSMTWTTGSELNNAGFEIERKLEGAEEFSKVGYIYGFGTTNEPTDYRFTDLNAFDGTSYYRFKQVDFNGRGTYSEVLTVEGMPSDQLGQITLYPLPVQDELNIRFGKMADDAKTANLRIFNSKKKVLIDFSAAVSSYELLEIEEVKDLKKGRYVVEIKYTNGEETTQEFVKE